MSCQLETTPLSSLRFPLRSNCGPGQLNLREPSTLQTLIERWCGVYRPSGVLASSCLRSAARDDERGHSDLRGVQPKQLEKVDDPGMQGAGLASLE
ncbi:hypothetical protein CERZMDRAFT_94015 [Cercospora zeae-maydis SCOH1-5]|uniref:Uncharacterized protein n=1 Tax=Cercospora zeae-maydis SCOH1-5 TaxID=717836 RepID=A0A6A6FQK0_9PEZI|nr:hypothetical protein CERZMDRAFT_94015 [Cercospora zeae-maydis SCOH1-5]